MQFKNVHIGYSQDNSVHVNFSTITPGLYFLVGANGSGKSTFLKTIFGIIPPLKGNILFDKNEIESYSTMERAQKIAYLSTGIPQVDYITVKDFIHLGNTPLMNLFGKITSPNTIQNPAIAALKLERFENRYLNQLSDGEKQLVCIAKTIQQDTSILLLDEPTSFLDPKNKRLLYQFLKEFAMTENKIIIISTHDIEVAQNFADSFLVIAEKSVSIVTNTDLNYLLTIY